MGKPGSRSHVHSIGHGYRVKLMNVGGVQNRVPQNVTLFFQIQVISAISGWSQRAVANRYYFTYVKVYVQTLL